MEVMSTRVRTELGSMPEDWQIATAADICERVVDCKNRTPPVVPHGDYAVVRTPNVRNGRFVRDDLRFTDESSFKEWTARATPQVGDVLITREAPLGEVCPVPLDLQVCLGQRMMLYRPDESRVTSAYLLYALMSSSVQKGLLKKIGGSTVGHAKVDDIRSIQLPLPPTTSEQRAIAEALEDADTLIDSLEQLLTKKRQIKQGAMQELLTGKRRLPGFERPWTTCRLGEISTITMGRTPARLIGSFWGSGHKWLSIADLKGKVVSESKEEITDAGVQGMEEVPEGTLLMSFKLTIGRLAFAGCKLYTNEAICALRNPQVDKELLYYALARVDFSLFGKQAVKGYTLNKESLRNVEVLLPSDPMEQRAIAQVLADLDTEVTALESRLTKARALKQAMAQALLTGRIRLVEPSA